MGINQVTSIKSLCLKRRITDLIKTKKNITRIVTRTTHDGERYRHRQTDRHKDRQTHRQAGTDKQINTKSDSVGRRERA